MMKNLFILVTFISALLGSCTEAQKLPSQSSSDTDISNGANSGGDGADNSGGGLTDDGEVTAKVEIRHLIEPKIDDSEVAGDYKRKLTVPKNYNGFLYVAGINMATLSDQNVKVRFNFGRDSLSKTIQATVGIAPGLTSSSTVQVLILDMKSRPFENIQLIYDLFDYNEYDFDGTGSNPAALTEPVIFNRDDKLFCRGLALADDSTFSGSLISGCSGSGDVCKYAYAKIADKGLIEKSSNADPDQPIVPSEQQIQSGSSGLYDDTDEVKLARCLPDGPFLGANAYKYDDSTSFLTFASTETINGTDYIYQGPYRALNTDQWEISSEALKGSNGLFNQIYDDNVNGSVDDDELDYGYLSYLFPLYYQKSLSTGTEYLGSTTPDAEKSLLTMNTNSESEWIDGCSARVETTHNITGEHIGSCSVTASIEIITEDANGNISVIDISKDVKLQLVSEVPEDELFSGADDALKSSYSQCSSSSQCGSDECCINSRCWDKGIVKQCIEDLPSYGNQITGESCSSDYQCASLCCNKISGRCASHDSSSNSSSGSLCSKPEGQSCVAKEWCAKKPVTTWGIVSTGTDSNGAVNCALRSVTVEFHGECTSSNGINQGICVPPSQPDKPVFDLNDPNRCNEAISYEELVECANNPETCTL